MKKVNLNISGRVQGVGYRVYAKGCADTLGIYGYAENKKDGSVQIVAVGPENTLFEFIKQCSKGPLLSKVNGVNFSISPDVHDFKEFTVVREEKGILHDQVKAFTNLAKNILHTPGGVYEKVIPKHVVIIPDGNRRWARERSLPTWNGHKVGGTEKFKEITNYFFNSNMEVLTLWGLSTENWNREQSELDYLMKLFIDTLEKFEPEFLKQNVVFRHLGRRTKLSNEVLGKIDSLTEKTKNNTGKVLCLALDYGGRDEIVRAINRAIHTPGGVYVSEDYFSSLLDTNGLPDPDLIIRTSGEQRLSGIMPWQSTYSELYFTDTKFPDFGEHEFTLALDEFANRKRRFGK